MKYIFVFLILFSASTLSFSQKNNFTVIAYYMGNPEKVDSLAADKLTHIIFSFCHLKGNKLTVDNRRDSTTLQKLVALKQKHPRLKIIVSLGGWGGCPTCSDVFSTEKSRKEFSESVLVLSQYFHTDGIDLDWEYPTIEGYPGHKYKPQDKKNFTALAQQLRKTLGKQYEISFAAGGFQKFLVESVEWKEVMKEMDRVNVMSYDLINGYSTVTGHHTALYSRDKQFESTDNAVQYLIKLGVPRNKIVIGAAFYARVWENVPATDNGLYQSGKFRTSIDFKEFPKLLSKDNGFTFFWDEKAKAPYAYNSSEKLFATFDDVKSITHKTQYVIDQRLDGIMFWELSLDTYKDGLLDAIYKFKK
ncbi:glycoside hydrolase family 18 protein [Chryseosolibacter indicus]|uniref:chitinase n=1 Tax=Chryseosolibacter indicus TaxID=2782351 RepID=A0ABS5VLN3_9BACT|nr:glycoside hydrolase family 18 protein [Chryseosolibacter indicus]MBT1701735.1 glycoside hydrolase family 18 protein [Chryseosolibacter indicus]